MRTPEISVIVPVYNVEKYLPRTLNSIIKQTFTNWECILIDDGTPDNSGKICDDFAEKDSRFKVIHQKNAGVSRARNTGLDNATGKWITIIDGDDWIDAETLETALNNSQNVDIVQWGYYRSSETEDFMKFVYKSEFSLNSKDESEPYGSHTCMLIKRDFLNNNQLRYMTDLSMGEDLIFAYQCCLKAKSVKNLIDKAFYHYIQHADSTTHKITLPKIQSQINFVRKFEELFSDTPYSDAIKSRILVHKLGSKMNLLKTYRFKLYKNTFPEIESILMQEKSRFTPAIHLLHYNLDVFACIYLFIRYRLSDIKQLIKKLLRK